MTKEETEKALAEANQQLAEKDAQIKQMQEYIDNQNEQLEKHEVSKSVKNPVYTSKDKKSYEIVIPVMTVNSKSYTSKVLAEDTKNIEICENLIAGGSGAFKLIEKTK
ncbi:hypothetical protein V9L05_01380 [Bernardetia sp. Wsw4-3y2]|uniref:hypothetical protein n=1 Tax=Bernardetia sp. Wsw4-3y2 TaxID=3127471 RepID=UPI0030D55ED3